MKFVFKQHSVLPGFGISLGLTLTYLALIVLIPLSALVTKTMSLTWAKFWSVITEPRIVQSYKLTILTSLAAALINAFFGLIVGWTLVRYRFPGRKIIDALIDLPFALPTAVSGIALATILSRNGWVGRLLPESFPMAYNSRGIVVALIFIGLPFVVRTLQPALEDLPAELEEAARSLGAGRFQIFRRVILPAILPALITGFALALARALGEYGSVIFIAGNLPMKTEITSLMIMMKLENYDYAGATAVAVVMLVASFVMLLIINGIQWWTTRKFGKVTN